MPSVEERLATLEGRIQEQATFMADVRGNMTDSLRDFRRDVDRQFQGVDRQFQQVDQRFDRIDKYFLWMFGAMMTGFTAVMAALIGGMLRLM